LEAKSRHMGTVLFMHGLGDSPMGWAGEMAHIQSKLPHLKFVLPAAPNMPVTLNGGMVMPAWHDLKSLGTIADDDFSGLDASTRNIQDIIQKEAAIIGSERIVVGGFSQGAAMALVSGYSFPSKLGGIVAMSGYLPRFHRFSSTVLHASNAKTPTLIAHGTSDPIVHVRAAEKTKEVLAASCIPFEFKLYDGMPHSACDQEIQDVMDFISQLLPSA